MKRVIEIVDEGKEIPGSKKVKFLDGVDESLVVLDINGCEEERVSVENGGIDFAQGERDIVPNNHDSPCFGVLEGSNVWDFDTNFDMFFSNGEEQKDFVFDLNLPLYRANDCGLEKAGVGYSQGQGPMINENKVEIIDIASDDSEDEVEIIGYSNAKDKQMELGMPCDGMDSLSLGLGVVGMDNASGQSSLMARGERRYTSEEKGKADAIEDGGLDVCIIDPWLSLNANSPIDLELQIDSDELIRSNEPIQDIEVRIFQPELPAIALDAAEEWVRTTERFSRGVWRDTARRFARIHHPDQDDGNQSTSKKQNPPTSSPVEKLGNSPGPFSDALKMVRERTSKQAAEQLIKWRCSEENQDRSTTGVFVPSLLDLSLKALAENAEGIVSLEQVPDNLRGRLTNILCDTSKMNAHTMNLLVEGCPTEIRVKNCSWLTETQFQQSFGNCQTKDLRVLQLDLCGQCVLDCVFRGTLIQSSSSLSKLIILSLRGACRLSDSGLKDLIMSAPALQSINLGQCALITSVSVDFIADSVGSNLKELYIDDCHKIDAMLMLPAFKKFRCLEVLSVAGILTITDHSVSEIVNICGRSIKELDLASCSQLTDRSLKAIGSSCAGLSSLDISNLHLLTDLAMEYLANGCKSIQKLKLCRNEFSDEAMAAFLESSGESLTELLLNNMAKIGPNTAFSLAKCSRKLLSLDISWCRKISNEALGLIVDSCSSLKLLKAFGCKQITDVFLNGHSNKNLRIIGLQLTPILDHLNLLEPEEEYLKYSSLSICMDD